MYEEVIILLIGSIGGIAVKNTIDLAVLSYRYDKHVKETHGGHEDA